MIDLPSIYKDFAGSARADYDVRLGVLGEDPKQGGLFPGLCFNIPF